MSRLRDRVGRELHRIIDRRIAEKLPQARRQWLEEPQIFGPHERLHIGEGAVVNDALFNTVPGHVTVGAHAFFGHGVMVLCGGHDYRLRRRARQTTWPTSGGDVVIGPGAWVASRAIVLGPCTIGADAVVAAGSVVTGEVPERAVVAGAPARVVRMLPPVVDVETALGPIYAHPHDEVITPDLLRHGGPPDPDLALIGDLAAGTVVDVGANIGYSVLAAAPRAEHVIAIEPHPANLALLEINLVRNGADNVTVVAAAAWDAAGEVSLAEATTNTGDHRAGVHVEGRTELSVRAVRIDDLVPAGADVRLIKLDTQATEHVALRGARETVARCRPVILAEFWPQGVRNLGEDPVAVLAEYRGLGYDFEVIEDPSLDGMGDAELVAAVGARPGLEGGFVTLRLTPSA